MKNRPERHKADNSFRFKSFNERILEVDIRKAALYHIEHENEGWDETQSHFHQAIQKWCVLNLSEEYLKFQGRVRDVVTLPQLLHKKELVINHLFECLQNASHLSLQPLLEFIVVLAKDLREEFYPYFPRFFEHLVTLLNTKDADQLEWTLLCLAFLFKILRGFLRKDISLIFHKILLFLDDSQPMHITNFAAECFSYIARDIKNKNVLINLVTGSVKNNENAVMGCGRMLFEVMRGVNQQFHSSAEGFMTILLEGLVEEENAEQLYLALVQTVTDMLQIISPKSLVLFWNIAHNVLDKCLEDGKKNEDAIRYLLNLMGQIIEHKNGTYLDNASLMIQKLVRIIDSVENEEIILNVSQISTLMMLSSNLGLSQLDASRLSKKMMSINQTHRTVFEKFVSNVIDYSQFEILILPDYLKFFEKNFDSQSLEILTEIVLKKAPLCKNGICLENWKQIPIVLKQKASEEKFVLILNAEDVSDFLRAAIIVPHVVNFEGDVEIHDKIENYVVKLSGKLDDKKNFFFMLSVLVESLIHFGVKESKFTSNLIEILLPLALKEEYSPVVNIIDILLTSMNGNKKKLDIILFNKIHSALKTNLSCPNHDVRLVTSHIFTLFNHLSILKVEDEEENMTIFDVLYGIESIPPTVRTYRDQIRLLQKLAFDGTICQQTKDESLKLDSLRYILSIFFVNFKLLWEPTNEVLKSFADEMAINEFWSVYKMQLDYVLAVLNEQEEDNEEEFEVTSEIVKENYQDFWKIERKADFVNYRVTLLKSLSDFKRIFESKNRDVVTMFFEFIEKEYRFNWNEGEEAENTPKATQKILIAFLTIFSKLNSPKNIFKCKDLYDLYTELLAHRNSDVQKLSLDCIMAYKDPHLVPYKETLYRMISDATIKQEMLTFIKGENNDCEVLEDHRPQFVPFLMKILYTKITLKSTKQEIKPLILRFIGKFREEEISIFTTMAFGYFEALLKGNPLETFKFVMEKETNFEEEMPANKIQSLMVMIEVMKNEFAGLKDENFIKYILKIKLCIDSVLCKTESNAYKALKSKGLLNLVDFFDHFDKYSWTEDEIEAIFHIHIWPILEKLPSDCIHKPTPLLKLFMVWSKNPKYYILLSKCKENEPEITPLPFVIKLLNGVKTSDNVSNEIMGIIAEMITLQSENSKFSVKNTVKIDSEKMNAMELNFGSTLLLPFIPEILIYIKNDLRRRKSIGKQNLLILSRTTELVTDSETCDTLLNLLLPVTIKRIEMPNVETETIRQMLTAILCLMKQVENPRKYIRALGPFFERITDLVARKTLVQILENVAEKDKDPLTSRLFNIMNDMNAMNKKWLEQPDFEKRLNAFRSVDKITESDEIDIDLAILFVYQCYYYMKNDKDLAIRDNSSYQVKKVCVKIIKLSRANEEDHKYFIEKVVLSALNKGIRDKNENARNESIMLIGELSRECPEDHRVFKDLSLFTNSEDREIDFFDNMTHLQIHRHRRAMARFCKIADKITVPPSSYSLVNFIVPIVSTYICTEKYQKKQKLTEAAGTCIAAICRLLPWNQYKGILRLYLMKLKRNIEHQKQIIKILSGILDVFHFELSKADVKGLKDIVHIIETTEKEEKDVEQKEDVEKIEEIEDEDQTIITLTQEQAEKVVYDISKQIIPDLFQTINYKSTQDSIKLNEKRERYEREKEDMLKIPIAIAVVKLLQKLPKHLLELNLPKLVLKVANFLRSNLKQVRNLARDTLKTMLTCLGVNYFSMMLDNLKAILKQGFHVHVLTVTLHTLLDALKDELNPESVDNFLQPILDICVNDIFGRLSEEKEVHEFSRKTPEAKPSKKSFLTLNILAKNMSEKSILDLILPFKDILAKTHSRKVVIKVEEAFHQISEGITTNKKISYEAMLIFVFGITSESIPDLMSNGAKRSLSEKEKERMKRARPDIYIIQREPKRRGAYNNLVSTTSAKTNSHVLVELGLEMLHTLIKRKHVMSLDYQAFLDPLIGILSDTLISKNLKVTILGLKCITSIWSTKLEMPNVEANVVKIVDDIFKILHKYATAGIMRKDDNFHLVKSGFKAMVTLLRYVKYFTFTDEQLKILLLYVEQDVYNADKQTMAFILLKAIVGRKLMVPEMHPIMMKVAEMCIHSELSKVREEARRVLLDYLMDYPLGKKIDKILNFFINQLDYEVISGRESAILMLIQIFNKFPLPILNKKSAFFFLAIGIRLVNDESTEIRQLVAESLQALITRIEKNEKNDLFELLLVMIGDTKFSHREMAAQLCVRFINVEKEEFVQRAEKIFPGLLASISNTDTNSIGRFVKLQTTDADDAENGDGGIEKSVKSKDHALFQTLVAVGKIFENCPSVLTDKKFSCFLDELSYSLQDLLGYGHIWVRQESLKLLGNILSTLDFEMMHSILNGVEVENVPREFLYSNPENELKSLAVDMCAQLIPGETEEETASQTMQNLLFIANVVKVISLDMKEMPTDEEKKSLNLYWLIRRMRYVVHGEVSKAPTSFILRKHVFNWMEALVALLDEDIVAKLAPSFLSPLVREITDEDHLDETVKQIATNLGNQIRIKIGDEEYDRLRLELQNKLSKKRMERKKFIALDKVNNPVKAAKRKISVQLKKKDARKRKRDNFEKNPKVASKLRSKRKRMEDLFT